MNIWQRSTAEFLGTAGLLATVIGSGIMAERLADGNTALALLGNTIPTGAILVVLITAFGPISGAHFNPAVTLAFYLTRDINLKDACIYVGAQVLGGLAGMVAAHFMFELPLIQTSNNAREGIAQFGSELIATLGLVLTIFATLRHSPSNVSWMVGLYITAAYWFTASTSFANPAVTIARSFTDTFSGIMPNGVPGFIIAQLIGAGVAVAIAIWFGFAERQSETR